MKNLPQSARFAFGTLAFVVAVASTGCRREQITEYRVPKEGDGEMAAASVAGEQPRIQGRVPAGWREQQPTGMSVATFAISGSNGRNAELSILPFPGAGAPASVLVNVVRQNAGLPALEDSELAKTMEPVEVAGGKGSLIDFTSATNSGVTSGSNRTMLTIYSGDGMTWFFKLAGEATLVTEQKPALLDFLKSVSFTSSDAMPAREEKFASTNPKQVVPATQGMPVATAEGPAAGKPAWELPASWKEVPPTQMLLAKFVAGSPDSNSEVTVSSLPGSAGGVLANVNRWRGQLGLANIGEEEANKTLTSLDVLGGKVMLVDVTGKNRETGKDSRMIAAIWPRSSETWFFKMTGDPAAVEREKQAFIRFVQSVRFPNG